MILKENKILLLEDNELFLETLQEFLDEAGFEVDVAKDGNEALDKSFKKKYDIYLLDVNVPFINGFDFLKELRDFGDKTPAIFITSFRDKSSISMGFRAGADDYIKKPFDLDELLLRINAVLNRYRGGNSSIDIGNGFIFNYKIKRVSKNGDDVHFSPKELLLLEILIKNSGNIVTKEMIEEHIWTYGERGSEGSVRVYINNLKKILGKNSIKNIRGVGYKLSIPLESN